ncbi:glycoside hydrolase family 88/105 protein [Paenibacillus sp. MAH-36]|uniref:Glycoside hydrolase family 88 protein n=1 Tax=Paenibacillus violae TaxID=3077234 RepID=A0ABU3RMB9_9BACL|nr:glycoside hydrolase family 88 protein [Paenibacillus sp. PFR10]MDU0205440.1 glycoside hydrolase family 88 protein [Paenibacillus sp. PFR10]
MKMNPYFQPNESIAGKAKSDEHILATVAGRFIGANPKHPPVYRIYSTEGFRRGADYRYEMDLEQRWPELEHGQFVYTWGKLWSDGEIDHSFSISCNCPVRIIVNGILQFASNLNEDVFPDRSSFFRAKLGRGWNHIVLEFVATATGCGGKFGTGSIKGFPMHILAPLANRDGQEGWVYSRPQSAAWDVMPGAEEEQGQDEWFPRMAWTPQERSSGCFSRIYGEKPGQIAYAWTKLENRSPGVQQVRFAGEYQGPLTVYLNGTPVFERNERPKAGPFEMKLSIPFGVHDLVACSVCEGPIWGVSLELVSVSAEESAPVKRIPPYPVEGLTDGWLYAGPFSAGNAPEWAAMTRMHAPIGSEGERTFWRADLPGAWVRPYLENAIYGKWNYPLGVTLYGILRTGQELGDPHYTNYAVDHIEQCTSMFAYSSWDQAQYGSPGVNHQLTLIDSLDDCGSFGAAMLEANKQRALDGAEAAAERIAFYITREQSRLEDGTLYRTRGTTDFMKDTVWCDDLYMSTPFLCKYYELTGDTVYLDDAAKQFLRYKKLMFIPEQGIMHHVFDFKFGKGNSVPWGRGNGWVLFSLTELLAVMPGDHPERPELVAFFRELCQGYSRLQGQLGLWHQVLTDPESYAEASCTSMFIYAFARGVRFGWLEEAAPYVEAVLRGWEGLTRYAIDKNGNVYGVCRGSGYSFNKLYYKDQLSWQLNDTHGIGIVLLAGIETIKLRKHLSACSH